MGRKKERKLAHWLKKFPNISISNFRFFGLCHHTQKRSQVIDRSKMITLKCPFIWRLSMCRRMKTFSLTLVNRSFSREMTDEEKRWLSHGKNQPWWENIIYININKKWLHSVRQTYIMGESGRLYRFDYTKSFWQRFRYTISSNNALATSMYHVRRTGFHWYRQFEEAKNILFFRIDKNTIRSTGDNRILATITPARTMIRTYVDNFTLTDLSILRRSHTLLRSNGNVLMRVWG